jgi:hypothetical protein
MDAWLVLFCWYLLYWYGKSDTLSTVVKRHQRALTALLLIRIPEFTSTWRGEANRCLVDVCHGISIYNQLVRYAIVGGTAKPVGGNDNLWGVDLPLPIDHLDVYSCLLLTLVYVNVDLFTPTLEPSGTALDGFAEWSLVPEANFPGKVIARVFDSLWDLFFRLDGGTFVGFPVLDSLL